ncbi:MAG: DUF1538 domain-containing protein [Oscillospiraceae bacterium]|nr:DUF1538 domain-containing protein [Oscillospiraceae bacterium]
MNPQLMEKIKESLSSVLPITAIVLALSITIVPLTPGVLVLFLFGSFLLIVGVGMFTLGVDMSMTPMGNAIGVTMSRAKRRLLPLAAAFLLGMLITVAEPDLTVLAGQVPAIPNLVLILTVAAGVGLFLVAALLRVTLKVPLSYLLVGLYLGAFVLAILFTPNDFIPVSFDSGGVTTGPITVPFIMALGVGLASVRNDKNATNDSFGLVALCSIGPILSVLILGICYAPDSAGYTPPVLAEIATTRDAAREFAAAFPHYAGEVAGAILPICGVFLLFQLFTRRFKRTQLLKIASGLVYTYVGLVMFLTGVNVGFMGAGELIGATIAGGELPFLLIPVGTVMGYFIVAAEPAVHVLVKQVEEVSMGSISQSAMRQGMSIGVAISIGIAMLRVLTGISILWFLIPGYAISLALTFFVPQLFTGVAFDAGGVASGPMTATFLLPFAMGACQAWGGNLMTDAFGLVALVAMTPLVAIQLLGLAGRVRKRLADDALRAELARVEDRVLYYD